jgi:uncharacterized RDD family membrane protein YckC
MTLYASNALGNIVVGYELASIGSRIVAKLIDAAAVMAATLLGLYLGGSDGELAVRLLVTGLVLIIVVQAYLLTRYGQTIGKKCVGIKIVKNRDSSKGGFTSNFPIRSVVNYLIGILPFYSIIDCLFIFSIDYRCLHDRLAGTKVVKKLKGGELYRGNFISEAWD